MAQYGGAVGSGYASPAGGRAEGSAANRGSISTGGRNYYSPSLANAIASGNQRQVAAIANASVDAINRYGNASYASVGRVLSSGLSASGGVPAYSSGLASIYRSVGTQIGRSPALTAGVIRLAQQSSPGLRASGSVSPMTGVGRAVGAATHMRLPHYPNEKALKAVGNVKLKDSPPGLLQTLADIGGSTPGGALIRGTVDAITGKSLGHIGRDLIPAIPGIGTGYGVQRVASDIGQNVQPGKGIQASAAFAGSKALQFNPLTLGVSALDPQAGNWIKGLGGNIGRDIVSLPGNVLPSTFWMATHPKDIPTQFANADPWGRLIFHGDAKGLYQHPVIAALEVSGLKGGIGGAIGRVSRLAPENTVLGKIGSRTRPAARFEGQNFTTNIETRHRYSPRADVKAKQVLVEKRRAAKAADLNGKAYAAEKAGNAREALQFRIKANQLNPNRIDQPFDLLSRKAHARKFAAEKASPFDFRSELERQAHEFNGGAFHARAESMLEALPQLRELLGQQPQIGRRIGFKGDTALSAIAQGILHPSKEAFQAEIGRLKALPKPSEKALAVARDNHIAQLQEALRVQNWDEVAGRARGAAVAHNALEGEVIKRYGLSPNEADIARLRPYAVKHMGARMTEGDPVIQAHLDALDERIQSLKDNLQNVAPHEAQGNPEAVIAQRLHDVARLEAERMALEKSGGRQLVDPNGKALTPDQIKAHIKQHGNETIGTTNHNEIMFVSHAPARVSGPGAFYKGSFARMMGRGYAKSPGRTGESVLGGYHDLAPHRMVEEFARQHRFIWETDQWAKAIDYAAARDRQTHEVIAGTKRAMERKRLDLAAHDGSDFVVVRKDPFTDEALKSHAVLRNTESPLDVPPGQDDHLGFGASAEHHFAELTHDALLGKGPDTGRYVLMPKDFRDGLLDNPLGTLPRAWRAYNSLFRQSVLSTSLSWLTGNVIEAVLRNVIEGAGPRSYIVGRRAMVGRANPFRADLSKAAVGPEGRGIIVGEGGHMAFAGNTPHQSMETLGISTARDLTQTFVKAVRHPAPHVLADFWRVWRKAVFESINSPLERNLRYPIAGKYIRDQLMPQGARFDKTFGRAVEQAAQGLRGTAEQIQAGRYVDKVYGRYSKFSPAVRNFLTTYTPFGAWFLNAITFIFRTLPQDHPVVTALEASANAMSQDWRYEHGLDYWAPSPVPDFLQGSIPVGSGFLRGPSRYTPFGAFTDLTGTLVGEWMPQVSGALQALQGNYWTGKPMKGKPGPVARLTNAVEALLIPAIPGASVAARLLHVQLGADLPGGSTESLYNPFKVTQSPPTSTGSGLGSTGSGGGSGSSTRGTGTRGYGSGSSSSSSAVAFTGSVPSIPRGRTASPNVSLPATRGAVAASSARPGATTAPSSHLVALAQRYRGGRATPSPRGRRRRLPSNVV